MALTEPAGERTSSEPCLLSPRTRGDRWVINGQKMFITGAHVADSLITIWKTEKEAKKSQSWTTIMVPRETPGVTINKIEDQLPSLRQGGDLL